MRRLLALLPVVVLAACTPAAPSPGPTSAPTAGRTSSPAATPFPDDGVAQVSCDHVIGTEPSPAARLPVLLDAVALPVGQQLQVTAVDGRWWAKQGLVVRPGTPVDLEIVGEAALTSTIGWGNPGPAVTRIRVFCPDLYDVPGWYVFAGGYTVDKPRCLPLRVRSANRETLARIPVGAPC
ncbi:hypothetical protein [Catellatospora citrea]|uniref:Lipoprotein n=1 Tax=Catellatospora citrea TaxID=53366 RepID=A0A8J3KPU8_9ACTN|nr:hypothetical protein [Catellatospora citrea]RKE02779.1 hypothetical protein C8E86_8088 [Catellatospora citrea]GIG02639.1 hypothetical protein Cci01nite_77320 [Catellatospora citrea]